MDKIFIGTGGSGTTKFIKSIERKFSVDSKPDTFFVESGSPITPKGDSHQMLEIGLSENPSKNAAHAFYKRTGFKMNREESIEDNIIDYIGVLKEDDIRTVFFNSVAKMSFFSRNNIMGLCCLTRHPLHSYISYTKKERHANLVKKFGGRDTKGAIEYFANSWIANISECLSLDHSVIIRYEHLLEDINKIPEIKDLFDDWDGSRQNHGLPEYLELYLKELVSPYFFKVYEKW